MRKPNISCNACGKEFYCRPSQINKNNNKAFCSRSCFQSKRDDIVNLRPCPFCKVSFKPEKKGRKFCSYACSNKARTGIKYNGSELYGDNSKAKIRFSILCEKFNFDCCMIEGCSYNKIYEIHRLHPGRLGGKYEIGNMFALCPNHHAEIHRHIISVEKINDGSLRIVNCVRHNSASKTDGAC